VKTTLTSRFHSLGFKPSDAAVGAPSPPPPSPAPFTIPFILRTPNPPAAPPTAALTRAPQQPDTGATILAVALQGRALAQALATQRRYVRPHPSLRGPRQPVPFGGTLKLVAAAGFSTTSKLVSRFSFGNCEPP